MSENTNHWSAGETSLTETSGWAIYYNPTPGGKVNADGTRSFGMIWPALLISGMAGEAQAVAKGVADILNQVAAEEGASVSSGAAAIAAERQRQIEAEGFTAEHDDRWDHGELARAAAAYAIAAASYDALMREIAMPAVWPWARSWWKPKTAKGDLVRAGALIAAEIDRLDRLAAPVTDETDGWDGEGRCPKCQGHDCDPEGGCVHDE